MHKAYIDYINSIGLNPSQTITHSLINSCMNNLMYQLSDKYVSYEWGERMKNPAYKKIQNDIQSKASSTSHREQIKRSLIDKIIISQISCESRLTDKQRKEFTDVFHARILGWNPVEHNKDEPLPSLAPIERLRGVAYSSSLARMYREALELNNDYIKHGTVWVVTSMTPDTIREELIAKGVCPSEIFIHTEESLTSRKIQLLNGYSWDAQCEMVGNLAFKNLLTDSSGLDSDRAAITYSTIVRALTDLNGHKYILSPEDLSLSKFLGLLECELSPDVAELVKSTIRGFLDVLGVHSVDANDLKARRLWDTWMSEAKVCQYHIKRMFTFENSHQHTNLFESIVKRGEHHIFFGDRIAPLAAIHLKDLQCGYSFMEDYLKSTKERPSLSAFIEFNHFVVEGFCVMPAAVRGVSISKNIFFGDQFVRTNGNEEEFASIMANTSLKVVRVSDGEPHHVEGEFLKRLIPHSTECDSRFLSFSCNGNYRGNSMITFEIPSMVVC